MSDDKKWNCQVDPDLYPDPQVTTPEGKVIGGLTVGRKFLLSCQGETGTLRSEILKFATDEKAEYRIKLVEVRKMAEFESEFIVTSYVPGDHSFKKLTVTDGLVNREIEGLQLQVNQVMNPTQPPEAPFGPAGPILLSLPWTYYGMFVAVGMVVFSFFGLKFFRRYQRKKLIEELKGHNTALGAFNQLQKDLRHIQREMSLKREKVSYAESISELEDILKLFLVRELLIPANKWGHGLISRELKRQYPRLHNSTGKELRDLLIEMEKAHAAGSKSTQTDFEQLIAQTREVASQIYRRRHR